MEQKLRKALSWCCSEMFPWMGIKVLSWTWFRRTAGTPLSDILLALWPVIWQLKYTNESIFMINCFHTNCFEHWFKHWFEHWFEHLSEHWSEGGDFWSFDKRWWGKGAFGHKDMGTNDRGPTIVYHKVAYHKVVYHRMPYHTKVYLDTRAWAQTTGETLARWITQVICAHGDAHI